MYDREGTGSYFYFFSLLNLGVWSCPGDFTFFLHFMGWKLTLWENSTRLWTRNYNELSHRMTEMVKDDQDSTTHESGKRTGMTWDETFLPLDWERPTQKVPGHCRQKVNRNRSLSSRNHSLVVSKREEGSDETCRRGCRRWEEDLRDRGCPVQTRLRRKDWGPETNIVEMGNGTVWLSKDDNDYRPNDSRLIEQTKKEVV